MRTISCYIRIPTCLLGKDPEIALVGMGRLLEIFCIKKLSGARFGLFSAKIGVATMVANFLVEPCAKTPRQIKYHALAWLLSPVGGLHLKFSKL